MMYTVVLGGITHTAPSPNPQLLAPACLLSKKNGVKVDSSGYELALAWPSSMFLPSMQKCRKLIFLRLCGCQCMQHLLPWRGVELGTDCGARLFPAPMRAAAAAAAAGQPLAPPGHLPSDSAVKGGTLRASSKEATTRPTHLHPST